MQPYFYKFTLYFSYLSDMFLYNMTLIIESGILEAAQKAVRDFLDSENHKLQDKRIHFLRMVDAQHDGETYCVQFRAADELELEEFKGGAITRLKEKLETEFGNKVLCFTSTMEYIHPNDTNL